MALDFVPVVSTSQRRTSVSECFVRKACSREWKANEAAKASSGRWNLINRVLKPAGFQVVDDEFDGKDDSRYHSREPSQKSRRERSYSSPSQTRPSPSSSRPKESTPFIPPTNTTPPSVSAPAPSLAPTNARKPERPAAVVNYPTDKPGIVTQIPVSMCEVRSKALNIYSTSESMP